jgi:hypothetical protein
MDFRAAITLSRRAYEPRSALVIDARHCGGFVLAESATLVDAVLYAGSRQRVLGCKYACRCLGLAAALGRRRRVQCSFVGRYARALVPYRNNRARLVVVDATADDFCHLVVDEIVEWKAPTVGTAP